MIGQPESWNKLTGSSNSMAAIQFYAPTMFKLLGTLAVQVGATQ